MYCGCGLYVVNLFKQKVVSPKNDLFSSVTLHNIFFHRLFDESQIVHSHMHLENI